MTKSSRMVIFNKNLLKNLKNLSFIQSIDKDRVLYLYCTGIALVFWVFLKLSKQYDSNVDVYLTYQIEENKSFISRPPAQVNVTINAKGWDLLSMNTVNKNKVYIETENRTSPVLTVSELKSIIGETIGADKIIRSVFLESEMIDLSMDDRIRKRVPLTENFDLVFDNGYDLKQDSVVIIPDSVSLSGPASVLTEIDSWPLENQSFVDLQTDVEEEVMLQKEKTMAIEFSLETVEVRIPVEQVVEKSLWVGIEQIGGADSLLLFPKRVYLTCIVPMVDYDKISERDFSIVADMVNVSTEEEDNLVVLRLSGQTPKARSVRFEPQIAEYFISVQE